MPLVESKALPVELVNRTDGGKKLAPEFSPLAHPLPAAK